MTVAAIYTHARHVHIMSLNLNFGLKLWRTISRHDNNIIVNLVYVLAPQYNPDFCKIARFVV